MKKRSVEERFFEKVQKVESGCHEWTGHVMKNGYGQLHYKGKTVYSHIMAYKLEHGHDSVGDLFVLHKCDNRKCVNPEHLFLGTFYDNMDDMVAKVRQAAGEKNFHAKLTGDQVIQIRKNTDDSHTELGIMFGVSRITIHDIKTRRSWRHI
jgi:hypothetical protein